MSIIHRAYTFDAKDFHRMLEQRTIRNENLDLKMFQCYAKEIFQNADEDTLNILDNFRFDEEWLIMEDDIWPGDNWYITCLVNSLITAPSLSNRIRWSYRILEMTLPLIGWDSRKITRLIEGDDLHLLLLESGSKPLISAFGCCRSIPYGGWLSNRLVKLFYELLNETKSSLDIESETIIGAITPYCRSIGINPEKAIHAAYSDLDEMLTTAINRNHDLIVLLYD